VLLLQQLMLLQQLPLLLDFALQMQEIFLPQRLCCTRLRLVGPAPNFLSSKQTRARVCFGRGKQRECECLRLQLYLKSLLQVLFMTLMMIVLLLEWLLPLILPLC
jgi:hypothetical protein